VAQLQAAHPNKTVEVWAFDEHRLGLKPIIKRVWTPVGQRPQAVVHPRYQWLYLYGFVHPESGRTEWWILPRVNVECLAMALADFAQQTSAGKDKHIVLLLDGAGWHTSSRLSVPEGVQLEFLPAYSPQLQPAERLWQLTDQPLANRAFRDLGELEEVLAQRCRVVSEQQEVVRGLTDYSWWPKTNREKEV